MSHASPSAVPPSPEQHAPGAKSQRSRGRRVFALASTREAARVSRLLRAELAGGVIVMIAAAIGFALANSPLADGYTALRDFKIGPESLHLNLSIGQWASDGLLAIFFFLVGLELKREFVAGELRRFQTAVVPVAAALGGVAVPALIYFAVNAGTPAVHGWAIPTATDIAFAVAVLAILAPRIPPALRMFLLTLAVVDDLVAIAIIAIFYTEGVQFIPLALALVPLAIYAFIVRRFPAWLARSGWGPWLILLPLGIATWALFHASGIHATIAGVVLAFLVPVAGKVRSSQLTAGHSAAATPTGAPAVEPVPLAEVFEHRFRPLSSGIAVPVFAFFAAGVSVAGDSSFPFDPIAIGILLGLIVGKPLGIVLTTWVLTKFTRASLDEAVKWREVIGVGALAGIGFTVAMLVAELSFPASSGAGSGAADTARLAVMAASVIAVGVAAAFLVRRPKAHTVASSGKPGAHGAPGAPSA